MPLTRGSTNGLAKSGCIAIAYETITDDAGGLPLLAPMSEVAGRLAVIEGASNLKANVGGRGVLISGVPGTSPAKVLVVGGGVVGINAAKMAIGLGARVTVFDRSLPRLRYLSDVFGNNITTRYSSNSALLKPSKLADMAGYWCGLDPWRSGAKANYSCAAVNNAKRRGLS